MAPPCNNCTPPPEKGKQKKRQVLMKKVIRAKNKGNKLEVAWNKRGQPIEPGGSTLISYIGFIVRQHIPITCNNWRDRAMQEYKENIWRDIQLTFIVDESHKKYVLKEAGHLHRGFRCKIANHFLKDDDGNYLENPPAHPPAEYAYIIKENVWREFVSKHADESFREQSKKNKERASNPKYPYRGSRMGYARLEQQMIKQSGPDVMSIPRQELWRRARVNKAGEIENENVQQVWDQCEALSQSLPPEEVQNSRLDILSRALRVPEYPGRVRAIGFGVSQRDYFPPQKRARHEDLAAMNSVIKEVCVRLAKVESRVASLSQKDTPDSVQQPDIGICSGNESCSLASDSIDEDPEQEVLTQNKSDKDAPTKRENDTRFGKNMVYTRSKVESTHVQETNPIPLDQIPAQSKEKSKKIKELRQSKELITTPTKNQPKSALPSFPVGGADNQLDRLPPSCKLLDRYVRKLLIGGDQLTICMEKPIFNFEYQEMIGQEQINELLYQKQIGASVVSIYIRYLFHTWLVPKQMLTRFSFLCLYNIALPSTNETMYNYKHFKKSEYIAEVFIVNEKRKKVFLAPYNTGEHWVLIVVNADAKTVYYLDPMHGDFDDHLEMKRLFNFALTIYHTGDHNIKWIRIKCPRQTNNEDSGYSVLRFMKEIISHNKSTIPEMYFSDCRFISYSQDQIDEIREEWSSYVFDHCT